MSTVSVSQISILVFWFIFAFLIFILALIARFYESSSGQITHYRLYIVPVLTMGVAIVRYVNVHQWGGDWFGDLLSFWAGILLIVLCVHLYRQMTNGRKVK